MHPAGVLSLLINPSSRYFARVTLAIVARVWSGATATTQTFTFKQQADCQPGKCEQKEDEDGKENHHSIDLSVKYGKSTSELSAVDCFSLCIY